MLWTTGLVLWQDLLSSSQRWSGKAVQRQRGAAVTWTALQGHISYQVYHLVTESLLVTKYILVTESVSSSSVRHQ